MPPEPSLIDDGMGSCSCFQNSLSLKSLDDCALEFSCVVCGAVGVLNYIIIYKSNFAIIYIDLLFSCSVFSKLT